MRAVTLAARPFSLITTHRTLPRRIDQRLALRTTRSMASDNAEVNATAVHYFSCFTAGLNALATGNITAAAATSRA
jgi:hypothetical protein